VNSHTPVHKFLEPTYLCELQEYVDDTYSMHYAKGKYQASELIIDAGYGEGFLMGNIIKYWKRYGKKEGKNRQDLLKILHYTLIMLYTHDHITKGE
jgi:hypothetical protein